MLESGNKPPPLDQGPVFRTTHWSVVLQAANEELQGFLPCGRGDISREALAAKRGVSVGAIDVAVHRLRQRFGALLREQVAQAVSSQAEIEEELLPHLVARRAMTRSATHAIA